MWQRAGSLRERYRHDSSQDVITMACIHYVWHSDKRVCEDWVHLCKAAGPACRKPDLLQRLTHCCLSNSYYITYILYCQCYPQFFYIYTLKWCKAFGEVSIHNNLVYHSEAGEKHGAELSPYTSTLTLWPKQGIQSLSSNIIAVFIN